MRLYRIVAAFVGVMVGCSSNAVIVPPSPDASSSSSSSSTSGGLTDAGPSGASCASVCANLAAHGCKAAQPTPEGHTCEEVCLNAAKTFGWDLACRSSATTCGAIDACK